MNRAALFRVSRSLSLRRGTHSTHAAGTGHNLFNADTELTHTSTAGVFSAHITKNWSVGDAPNGGYLMAMAISAARKVVPFRDPLSMTAYYCNKALEGAPVDIEVKTLNQTKGSATVVISFVQEGIVRSHYTGTFGTLGKQKGLNFSTIAPAPQLPPPEDCVDCSSKLRKHFGEHLRVANRVQFRAPKDDPFVLGALAKQEVHSASLSCWVRFDKGERAPCLRSFALFCDVLPPPILAVQHSNWVPTLEYTVHFWQRAELTQRGVATSDKATDGEHPYWLRCRYSTPFALNGMLYTDAELWSEDGTQLLATARQLAKVLTPR